ncbi:MAG: hypothetical protein P4L43_02960 [Syntrophobacteraceae bacterium]|nr:hypothetical protein [Syntrophobacteraceae bacterium]
MPIPPRDWLGSILVHHQIDIIDPDLEISIKAALLPPVHKDPCERFLIATALARELPVVTADPRFASYGVRVLI